MEKHWSRLITSQIDTAPKPAIALGTEPLYVRHNAQNPGVPPSIRGAVVEHRNDEEQKRTIDWSRLPCSVIA